MLITCPTHGETEGYDDRSDCKLCACEYAAAHRAKRQRIREGERQYVAIAGRDSWLTCNTCGLVLVDRHTLYIHKRGQHSSAPFDPEQPFEPRSLLPSSLGQV